MHPLLRELAPQGPQRADDERSLDMLSVLEDHGRTQRGRAQIQPSRRGDAARAPVLAGLGQRYGLAPFGQADSGALGIRAPRQDIARLMHAAAGGDECAWGALVDRFNPKIRAVAAVYQLADADRDEVTQRTWLALVRNLPRLKHPAAVAGWLAITARHESLRLLKDRAGRS
jgi:hypothetical protein